METVIGTVNLAPRRIIKAIIPSTVQPGFWLAVDTNGNYVEIDPTGAISAPSQDQGAWQCFKKSADGMLAYFKHGVLSIGEGFLD